MGCGLPIFKIDLPSGYTCGVRGVLVLCAAFEVVLVRLDGGDVVLVSTVGQPGVRFHVKVEVNGPVLAESWDTCDAALNEGENVLAVGTFGERVREVIRAVALDGDVGVKPVVAGDFYNVVVGAVGNEFHAVTVPEPTDVPCNGCIDAHAGRGVVHETWVVFHVMGEDVFAGFDWVRGRHAGVIGSGSQGVEFNHDVAVVVADASVCRHPTVSRLA